MFQFPRFPLPVLCIQTGVTPHYECWVSPFGHLRIKARSTAPRSISQPTTSFIGSRRQGIHRWHFIAWYYLRCSCSLCSCQRSMVVIFTGNPVKERPKEQASPALPIGEPGWACSFKTKQRNSDNDGPHSGGRPSTKCGGYRHQASGQRRVTALTVRAARMTP